MKYTLFVNLDLSDINKHIGMWFHYLKYDKDKIKYKNDKNIDYYDDED